MSSAQIQRAQARAQRLYDSDGFRGAYVKGARAALHGSSVGSCPYKAQGWGAAYRKSWVRGFQSIAPEE